MRRRPKFAYAWWPIVSSVGRQKTENNSKRKFALTPLILGSSFTGMFLAPQHKVFAAPRRKIVKLSRLSLFVIAWFALNGAMILPVCGGFDDQTGRMQVDNKPFGIGSTESANSKLENAVKTKLDGDEQLKTARLTVRADVTRNQVTLAGTVPSEALRIRALELARSAQAGVIVSDKINVKSKASIGTPPWRGSPAV